MHTNTTDIPVGFEIQTKELLTIAKDRLGNEKIKRKSHYSINQLEKHAFSIAWACIFFVEK